MPVAGTPVLPRPRNPRYPSLDMWRGLACLLVLLNHAVVFRPEPEASGWATVLGLGLVEVSKRCWIGVPVFFVISGYCISATADSTRRKGKSIGEYFYRRVRRIFPPYWAALATAVAAVVVLDCWLMPHAFTESRVTSGMLRPWWYSPWQWFGNVTLTEIWRHYLVGGTNALFLPHAWTLCYEEQFYAVTGLMLLIAPRRLFPAMLTVTIAVIAVASAAAWKDVCLEGFFFDGLWCQFALGVLAYYLLNYASPLVFRLGLCLVVCGLAGCCVQPMRLLEADKNALQSYLAAFAFALAALSLQRWDGRLMRLRVLAPIRVCGTMCYSLYLVHLPVIAILRACLFYWKAPCDAINPWITMWFYGGAAIAVAWLFHVVVERRFLNKPQRVGELSVVSCPLSERRQPAATDSLSTDN